MIDKCESIKSGWSSDGSSRYRSDGADVSAAGVGTWPLLNYWLNASKWQLLLSIVVGQLYCFWFLVVFDHFQALDQVKFMLPHLIITHPLCCGIVAVCSHQLEYDVEVKLFLICVITHRTNDRSEASALLSHNCSCFSSCFYINNNTAGSMSLCRPWIVMTCMRINKSGQDSWILQKKKRMRPKKCLANDNGY